MSQLSAPTSLTSEKSIIPRQGERALLISPTPFEGAPCPDGHIKANSESSQGKIPTHLLGVGLGAAPHTAAPQPWWAFGQMNQGGALSWNVCLLPAIGVKVGNTVQPWAAHPTSLSCLCASVSESRVPYPSCVQQHGAGNNWSGNLI